MGATCSCSSSSSLSLSFPDWVCYSPSTLLPNYPKPPRRNFTFNPTSKTPFRGYLQKSHDTMKSESALSSSSSFVNLNSGKVEEEEKTQDESSAIPIISELCDVNPELFQQLVYDALVWSSLHGLLVGDKSIQRSGTVPGVGLVHAPFALLPTFFPQIHWQQACELAPLFNELVDRVSLDGKFLQESLSRTKKVDAFTSRLLDIHSAMLEINKKEEIRLGLHRSDYMLDAQTNALLQIELNTISASFAGLGCVVSELHRNLLNHYGKKLGLDPSRVPINNAVSGFAEALAKAWNEYNNSSAVVLVVVQTEERNMYDQHWLSTILKERHSVTAIRKTMAEIDAEGELQPDGTLLVGDQPVSVIYFRAGYAPSDYPSESEWRARLLMEQSSAVKCPSISYHLAGTKKIQQELAKPNVLERFLENKDDVAKLRKCFAGLWSLDYSDIVKSAIERPDLFVLKPQREGGGNNVYGDNLRETLLKLEKEGSEERDAYILMQRIFPGASPAFLVQNGVCHQDHAISELGMYGCYLRYQNVFSFVYSSVWGVGYVGRGIPTEGNKDKIIINDHCGYLLRTKVSSSNEGGVAAGFAVLDSIYLT